MKIKTLISWSLRNFPLAVLSFLFISIALVASAMAFMGFIESKFPAYVVPGVSVARAEVEEEMPIRLWVLNQFHEAGLNVDTADRIISCESKFNVNAININKDKSFDAGIYQINSIHKDITLQDKIDYKKSTDWVIKKIKHDGGWQAWVCR